MARLLEEFPAGHGHCVTVHEHTTSGFVAVRLGVVDVEGAELTIATDEQCDLVEALRKAGAALHTAARKIDERIIQIETLGGR